MSDTDNEAAGSSDESWATRVQAHEQAVQGHDSQALRAAQQDLRTRLETHGLSPAEAELLGQITMVLDE